MNNYCLIMAGGNGERLWPVSRSAKPKQFLDLFGNGRTLLQQTYDRMSRFMPKDRIFVSTNVQYLSLVHEQLPEVDDLHILEEPVRRGTLAAVAWASVFVSRMEEDACLYVTPSDHLIFDETAYAEDILKGLDFASREHAMLVMGIRPTRPDTAYGYIQKGEATDVDRITCLKTFTEKPQKDFAELFMNEEDFLWNVGIHIFPVRSMLDLLYKNIPEYQLEIPRMMEAAASDTGQLVPEFFEVLPNLSLDADFLDHAEKVFVLEGRFGWADLGTWSSLHDYVAGDEKGNVLLDTQGHLYDCEDTVIRLPKGRQAVVKGLKGYVVAEEGEFLMICPTEDVATMRRMHTDAKFS